MNAQSTLVQVRTSPVLRSVGEAIRAHLAVLALADPAEAGVSALSPWATVFMLLVHLGGLAAFWRYYHQSVWLALPTLIVLLLFPVGVSIYRRWASARESMTLGVETLAPLFFLYLILIARVVAVRVLLAAEPYQDEASFADPRFVAFQVEATVGGVAGYWVLAASHWLLRGAARTRLSITLAAVLAIAALGWFSAETFGHRSLGATATDPYAYVQMAVDLATRGTPLHEFSLFPYIANLGVSWYPIEHMGYRLFDNLTGNVPTVWPVGGSVALAIAYRVWGEPGLYIATPLAALAALLALGFLARVYFHERPAAERAALAAVSIALLATSWEQVDRTIVPLVDTQAQLFSVLAIACALIAVQRAHTDKPAAPRSLFIAWAVAAGLALGAAYEVRHTQLLLVVPVVVAAFQAPPRRRFTILIPAGVAALVVALPDLWYHQVYIGGVLAPESQELVHFAWSNIGTSLDILNQRFMAGNEFGYLIPFLLYGLYRTIRDQRGPAAVLVAWVVVLGGFHLFYAAVKLRDVLPEYPAVILVTAYGLVACVRDLRRWALSSRGPGAWRYAIVAVALYLAFLLPAMRDRPTLLRPFLPAKVTFGYVTAAQRQAFDQITALTPPAAVVGSTMNDGAIDLYAQRATFRPGAWSAEELGRFIDIMRRERRPVYILDDGAETSQARRDLAARYGLRQVAVLDVPLFGVVDATPGALWLVTELGSQPDPGTN